jgi:hypothetical protein
MVATDFAKNSKNAPPGVVAYAGPHVQTTAQVADILADVIEHPVAEVYTNPRSRDMVQDYFADVEAYEARGIGWGSAPAGR